MRYDYIVKHNGKIYNAGEDVPIGASSSVSQEEELPFTDNAQSAYTKTDINRMSTDDLRKLAFEMGVDGADGISGAELKKILIDKLGL